MIIIGFAILWFLLLWLSQPFLSHVFQDFQKRDQQRLIHLKQNLHRHFIFHDENKIRRISYFFFGTAALVSLLMQSLILLLLTLSLFFIFPIIWVRIIEMIRKKKFQKQLLLFIPSLSSLLKSGHGLEKSFQQLKHSSIPPISEELGFMIKEMQLGITLEESLFRLSNRFPSDNMNMLVHAITISRKLGTSLSEVMDHIATNVLEKEKLRQQVLSLTSQGKLQAWVAAAMPLFMGLALQLLSPTYFRPLFQTPFGFYCILYCVFSMAVGLFWIHRITHKEYL